MASATLKFNDEEQAWECECGSGQFFEHIERSGQIVPTDSWDATFDPDVEGIDINLDGYNCAECEKFFSLIYISSLKLPEPTIEVESR